jgi:NAD(P)-dependent dehydrogenase (short-subunit alcohol dehydrogenase family)
VRAVVTGAAGALGRAVVDTFGKAGWEVKGFTRQDADLLDADAVQAAFGRLGRIDALVCCAGGYSEAPVHRLDPAEFRRLFDLNVMTAFNAIRAALPLMNGRGAIVTVSSRAAAAGEAGLAAYTASKAALLRLTETVGAENPGIRCNAVLPGIIDTPQNRADMPGADTSAWVPPTKIAGVILFLCADDAVRGASIPV